MALRLVLFDVDGTLIDSAGAGRRAMEHAFHEVFGIDGVGLKAARVRYAGMTDPRILEAIAEAVGLPGSRLTPAGRHLEAVYLEALQEEMSRPDPRRRVLPGVRELLETLVVRPDVVVGLVTGNLEAGAQAKLAAFDLTRYFAGGGFASDHPDRREIARLAWRKLCSARDAEIPPERVCVVGDTEHDVDCARANGFRAVAVHSGWVDRAILEAARPDVLLDTLDDPGILCALDLTNS